jgi:hypothetical protein
MLSEIRLLHLYLRHLLLLAISADEPAIADEDGSEAGMKVIQAALLDDDDSEVDCECAETAPGNGCSCMDGELKEIEQAPRREGNSTGGLANKPDGPLLETVEAFESSANVRAAMSSMWVSVAVAVFFFFFFFFRTFFLSS